MCNETLPLIFTSNHSTKWYNWVIKDKKYRLLLFIHIPSPLQSRYLHACLSVRNLILLSCQQKQHIKQKLSLTLRLSPFSWALSLAKPQKLYNLNLFCHCETNNVLITAMAKICYVSCYNVIPPSWYQFSRRGEMFY